jgi:putative FmdB family regulatory protein
MPFYEYQCPHCGFDEEVLQSINDKPLKRCPHCGKTGLKKLISAPVFRLKGSGWYETDFKSDNEKKRNLAGAEKDESRSDSKADDKKDAKPEAKGESKADSKADSKAVAKPTPVKPRKAAPKPKSARKARR